MHPRLSCWWLCRRAAGFWMLLTGIRSLDGSSAKGAPLDLKSRVRIPEQANPGNHPTTIEKSSTGHPVAAIWLVSRAGVPEAASHLK